MNSIKEKIIAEINQANKIGFITHKEGDGDAFGSMLALERVIHKIGKKTVIFSNEKLPQIFEIIENEVAYNPVEQYENIDLLICFDANSIKRFSVPAVLEAAISKTKIVVIDHHLNGELEETSTLYWRDLTVSSTSEMVFHLISKMGLEIDKITATLLLFGIETDTFSLQFTNTSPSTFRSVAELLKKGARLKTVVESAFGGKPITIVKLLGRAIDRMKLEKSGLAHTYITLKDMEELDLTEQSSSGVANFLDQVKEAKVTVVLQEKPNGIIRVSMRSNNSDINVAEICEKFGGGGHSKASGFETEGTISSVAKKVIDAVNQVI